MTKISTRINDLGVLLKEEGFARRGRVWNRADGAFIDVVDVQISKSGDTCTVNLGVIDRDIYQACWGREPPDFSRDAECTVRERLGILLTGCDRWWPLGEASAWVAAIAAVQDEGLAFLSKMHSAAEMEAFLRPPSGSLPPYPPDAISLALLRSRQGDPAEGCRLLTQLLASTTPAWRDRVESVIAKYCRPST